MCASCCVCVAYVCTVLCVRLKCCLRLEEVLTSNVDLLQGTPCMYIYIRKVTYIQVAENLTVKVLTAMDDIEIIQSKVGHESRAII